MKNLPNNSNKINYKPPPIVRQYASNNLLLTNIVSKFTYTNGQK